MVAAEGFGAGPVVSTALRASWAFPGGPFLWQNVPDLFTDGDVSGSWMARQHQGSPPKIVLDSSRVAP